MDLNILKPRKALNKAFLKVKAQRTEIELFKTNLISLLDTINENESEEFHKNIVSKFLTDTYYNSTHYINTKGRNDLVIHNTNSASGTVGVIVEAKKPTNKAEMLKPDNINTKAFQELVLYYLRERITEKNLEIKHLVATNIYEWYIFDASVFEKEFAQNKNLVKQFTDFEEKRLSGDKTDFFYKNIAQPAIEAIKHEITFTHFDIRDYDKPLRNNDKNDDNTLIALYKLLSPEHLLKLPFANDSNSLDKSFYTELLHIIGLTETKDGSKKLIQRKKEGERNSGSLIESAIFQLDNLDKISRLEKPSQFGETNAERLFSVALELTITWINRILFLKLLEAQLLKYHKGDKSFAFLNLDKVQNFDDLNNLFFSVLARKPFERNDKVKTLFANVPYLNSSLFEPTALEHSCLFISQLTDGNLPLLSSTVIKNNNGKKQIGELDTIEYIFEFLNAYDFASEGSEEIQEDNKSLINASVLGLIFEKINGYKDGSFFTPGFITMYMCRETIRRAVVQKFNETKGWNCADIDQVYDKIDNKKEANTIVNSLKICDPAVGSGHFLVSALNEIIAIKSDLKILLDRQSKTLRDYQVEVVNDELIIINDDGGLFEYNPKSKESQRIQETLFHEKQTIIENCLFGVDLNPNSVKICRLRLWIELLKNAYYKAPDYSELETLPNIDINIKCGNSLISRYALDADIKTALKRSKWTIDSYRLAVMTYRNAQSKDEKRSMETLINQIKNDFESEIAINDKRKLKLSNARGELLTLTTQTSLFERTKAEKQAWDKQVKSLTENITSLETELEEIRSNKIYENAFEWRFEFPEVLNDEGEFIGFDAVIGNPPYIAGKDLNESFKNHLKSNYKFSIGKFDVYLSFIELGLNILNSNKIICFIIPNTFLANENVKLLREYLINHQSLNSISLFDDTVFAEAFVESLILQIDNLKKHSSIRIQDKTFTQIRIAEYDEIKNSLDYRIQENYNIQDEYIIKKVENTSLKLGELVDLCIGIQLGGEGDSKDFKEKYISKEKKSDEFKKMLDGKDFEPYKITWGNKYIMYGDWLHRKRDDKYFLNPKIMIRQIGETPVSTIDYDGYYTLNTIYNGIITNNDFDIKYVYGLINSRLNKFIWKRKFSDGKALFPKVKKSQLIEIPIANVNFENQKPIIELVNSIFISKSKNNHIDTHKIEVEIDKLVYKIYGLTEDEIKIIEAN